MKISVIIPVYKNKELFFRNFNHNYDAINNFEIIVVDDASSEDVESQIKNKFKKVKVLVNKKNIGFAGSINRGLGESHGELILLLNSDVKLEVVNFENLISQFVEDRELFAISFLQTETDGEKVGKNVVFFERGLIYHKKADNLQKGLTAWAEGGSSIFRKKYFVDLGGFDEIYAPFYFEDIDLSYRAYKRGWKILFDPGAKVEHHHESTIGKYYTKEFINKISFRNQFIFIWKNLEDPGKIFSHIIFLPYYILSSLINKNGELFNGFISATTQLQKILNVRRVEAKYSKLRDKEIFKLFD